MNQSEYAKKLKQYQDSLTHLEPSLRECQFKLPILSTMEHYLLKLFTKCHVSQNLLGVETNFSESEIKVIYLASDAKNVGKFEQFLETITDCCFLTQDGKVIYDTVTFEKLWKGLIGENNFGIFKKHGIFERVEDIYSWCSE